MDAVPCGFGYGLDSLARHQNHGDKPTGNDTLGVVCYDALLSSAG
jgi:hypothetical protein